ncbi:tetratricopeptide repeat protein [Puniceicoccales bacterium CK1056]|uniref:Tetratricopeptide repeat protein n=1 Tax=Oceanipulchritudo coccoides TaxID=2706888 RepID=A0A6B2LZ28_9BACT|nr:tetratricopeptide repeat protein [Oceanipulchritudo coccoides]NDV61027.1 tetratricopeptide repeat protein [Oceanipulchritudo coccoides]
MIRTVFTFICLVTAFSTAHGFLWFGEDPIDTSPVLQTEKARPIYEKALTAQREGKTGRALRAYKKVYRNYPAADFAAQSLYNSGIIYFEKKKWKKAFGMFQTILIYHPDFPQFNELIDYQFRIALATAEGESIRLLYVIPYRALNRAVGYFEIVISNAPYSEYAPLALINVALIHQYKGQTAEAIDALDRLINNYPSSLLADDAYLSLAETFATLVQGPDYDQGATREAISYFEDFLILFSNNQDVARAEKGLADMEDVYARSKLVIGEYYFKYRRWFQAAEIFFNEAITIAPESAAAESARAYISRIQAIRANRPMTKQEEASPERQKEKSFIRRWLDRIIPG